MEGCATDPHASMLLQHGNIPHDDARNPPFVVTSQIVEVARLVAHALCHSIRRALRGRTTGTGSCTPGARWRFARADDRRAAILGDVEELAAQMSLTQGVQVASAMFS